MSGMNYYANGQSLKFEVILMAKKFIEIQANHLPNDITPEEYKGKPYYSILYAEDDRLIVGFGTYKVEVLLRYLKEYFNIVPEKQDELEHRTVRSEDALKEIKKTGHGCKTCKYGQKWLTEEPCSSCDIRLGNNKWEPEEEDGDKS